MDKTWIGFDRARPGRRGPAQSRMGRSVKSTTVTLLLLFSASGVGAEEPDDYGTGNWLYRTCESKGEERGSDESYRQIFHAGECFGFVFGVEQGHLATATQRDQESAFCIPKGVEPGQVSEVTRNYLGEHPEGRHRPAASLVLMALVEAFPCEKGESP